MFSTYLVIKTTHTKKEKKTVRSIPNNFFTQHLHKSTDNDNTLLRPAFRTCNYIQIKLSIYRKKTHEREIEWERARERAGAHKHTNKSSRRGEETFQSEPISN